MRHDEPDWRKSVKLDYSATQCRANPSMSNI